MDSNPDSVAFQLDGAPAHVEVQQTAVARMLARRSYVSDAARMIARVASIVTTLDENDLVLVSELIDCRFRSGHKIMILGNGGSCATASHLATDLTLLARAAQLRASVLALYDNPSIVSAMVNDHGFDASGAALVEASASCGDLLILFSCSGSSPNIVSAARMARELGVSTVLVGSRLAPSDFPADHLLLVPSDDYSVIESAHLIVVHIVVDLLRIGFNVVSSRHPGALARDAIVQL